MCKNNCAKVNAVLKNDSATWIFAAFCFKAVIELRLSWFDDAW